MLHAMHDKKKVAAYELNSRCHAVCNYFVSIVRLCIKLSPLESVHDDFFHAFRVQTFGNRTCIPGDVHRIV
jgi:hypothetical protein